MTTNCRRVKSIPLEEFDSSYLVFTGQRGVLRCLRPDEDFRQAQGLHMGCPLCKGTDSAHYLTLLFDLPGVPKDARPWGRWTWFKAPLSNLTLAEKVFSHACGFEGFIACGKIRYKA